MVYLVHDKLNDYYMSVCSDLIHLYILTWVI